MRKWSYKLQNKIDIRKTLLKIRETISSEERLYAAKQAAVILQSLPFFSAKTHFACYFSHKNEFDCAPLMQMIWQAKKFCYLPILTLDKTLEFALYHQHDPLKTNRYQIHEPITRETIPLEILDVILMPLVGFDLQGNRLGMGGGYYDRTFEKIAKASQRPYFIGLAYEAQKCETIPHDAWDVPLDGVLTEKQWYSFK